MTMTKLPDPKLAALWETLAVDNRTMRVVIDKNLLAPTLAASGDTNGGTSGGDETLAGDPMLVGPPPVRKPVTLGGMARLAAINDESASELADFRVTRTLGQGGMGIVRLARQSSLHRDVAVKTILPDALSEKATVDILREAWITGLIEHPNVIPVHSLGLDEFDSPMLVMKMVEGVDWSDALEDPEALPQRFRTGDHVETHLAILMQVCNAVHFAHSKGIIHRDLKPANVMLGAFGEVYVVDWGIAASLVDDGTGRLPLARDINGVAGTASYLAPEMAAGLGAEIDERTDVYLLGSILHEIVTGTPRHAGKNVSIILLNAYQSEPVDYDESVPRELAAICNRATHKDRAQRFATAEDFRLALVDYMQHRDSRRLATEAEERRRAMTEAIEAVYRDRASEPSANKKIEHEVTAPIYTLFTECRFGFDQALRVWPGNEEARAGLQAVLETMADFELVLGDDKAAALLIADLTDPDPDLVERLEALRANLSEEGREIEQLRELRHSLNATLGSRARAIMAVFLGVVLAVIPLINSYLLRQGVVTLDFPSYFAQFGAVLGGMTVVVFVMRRRVLRNMATTRIVGSIFLALMGGFIMRVMGYLLGLDVAGCVALENGMYAVIAVVVGAFTDRRLIPGGLAFLAGAILMAIYPQWMLEFDAASNAGALWTFALVWWMVPDSSPTDRP